MYPEVQPFFADTDIKKQKKKLLESLVLVVNNLRKPDVLAPALKNRGERHQEIGVRPEHYPMVGTALLETFAEYLGSEWTSELKGAWSQAYSDVVAGISS